MKAILTSIRPEWVVLILNGLKTVEIRKMFPSDYVGWVYIYCTKEDSLGRIKDLPHDRYFVDCVETPEDFEKMDSGYDGKGKVVARFWCDKVGGIHLVAASLTSKRVTDWHCDEFFAFEEHACLTQEDLDKYLGSVAHCPQGKAIHITKVDPFDKPKELKEFYKVGYKKEQERLHSALQAMAGYYSFHNEFAELKSKYQLTRAPQSWCYIEI